VAMSAFGSFSSRYTCASCADSECKYPSINLAVAGRCYERRSTSRWSTSLSKKTITGRLNK
jgi:hypothetical protein